MKKKCKPEFHRYEVKDWKTLGGYQVRYYFCRDCGFIRREKMEELPFEKLTTAN
jgi:hypothetical protein|tara:strand:- start:1473 stop:1634 length:162 start_codon:yes stop_codon:yes gene_type:complete